MCYYKFEMYEWMLKTKNHDLARGFFVTFPVNKGQTSDIYPLASGKRFAFCPSMYFREFQSIDKNTLYEVPDYIIFFDAHEIESLNAVIPFHY